MSQRVYPEITNLRTLAGQCDAAVIAAPCMGVIQLFGKFQPGNEFPD